MPAYIKAVVIKVKLGIFFLKEPFPCVVVALKLDTIRDGIAVLILCSQIAYCLQPPAVTFGVQLNALDLNYKFSLPRQGFTSQVKLPSVTAGLARRDRI